MQTTSLCYTLAVNFALFFFLSQLSFIKLQIDGVFLLPVARLSINDFFGVAQVSVIINFDATQFDLIIVISCLYI